MSTKIACDECDKKFETPTELQQHLELDHQMDADEALQRHPELMESATGTVADEQPEVTFSEDEVSAGENSSENTEPDLPDEETTDEVGVTYDEEPVDVSETDRKNKPNDSGEEVPSGEPVENGGVSVSQESVDVSPSTTGSDPSRTREAPEPNVSSDGPTGDSESVRAVDQDGHLDQFDADRNYRWFLFGVGGCGGNLIDSVILRSETIRNGAMDLDDAWPEAVRGIATVNTNSADELDGTYYAQTYRSKDARDIAREYKIGPDGIEGAGAVEKIGSQAAQWTFEQAEDDFAGVQWGGAADHSRISSAQAVIFLHSAVKGTGTGATPVIAQELDAAVGDNNIGEQFDMLNTGLTKFSVSVLPDSSADKLEISNGIVGFARLAKQVDAIIPFDNKNLDETPDSLRVNIEGTDNYQVHKYRERNEILVSFLETFAFSGVRKGGDEESVMGGDGFDLEDAYNPARVLYAGGGNDMAVVMAPAYGEIRTGSGEFTQQALESLVTNTLTEGKLVDFDHETGWGGAFLFETPQSQHKQVEQVVNRHFDGIVERPEHLNTGEDAVEGDQMFPTRTQYLFRSDIDSVRLWALIYNPEMSRLTQWRNWGERHRGGPQQYQQRLDEKWDEIESVFTLLGRKNLEQ